MIELIKTKASQHRFQSWSAERGNQVVIQDRKKKTQNKKNTLKTKNTVAPVQKLLGNLQRKQGQVSKYLADMDTRIKEALKEKIIPSDDAGLTMPIRTGMSNKQST
jgi:predicted transcriptional regulator